MNKMEHGYACYLSHFSQNTKHLFAFQFSSVTKRGPKDFFKGELGEEEDVPQFKAPASSKNKILVSHTESLLICQVPLCFLQEGMWKTLTGQTF